MITSARKLNNKIVMIVSHYSFDSEKLFKIHAILLYCIWSKKYANILVKTAIIAVKTTIKTTLRIWLIISYY